VVGGYERTSRDGGLPATENGSNVANETSRLVRWRCSIFPWGPLVDAGVEPR